MLQHRAVAHDSDTTALKDYPDPVRSPVAHSSGHKKGLRAVAIPGGGEGTASYRCQTLFSSKSSTRNVDLEDAAQNLLYYLHIDPDRRLSQAFVHAASKVMDANVTLVLVIAFLYAAGRFIEGTAYGGSAPGESGWRLSRAQCTFHLSCTSSSGIPPGFIGRFCWSTSWSSFTSAGCGGRKSARDAPLGYASRKMGD